MNITERAFHSLVGKQTRTRAGRYYSSILQYWISGRRVRRSSSRGIADPVVALVAWHTTLRYGHDFLVE